MRWPRVRFTVRRMMIAVAITGVTLGVGLVLHRRAAAYRSRAAYHEAKAVTWMGVHAENDAWATDTSNPERASRAQWAVEQAWAAIVYHRNMCDKYLHAARYPWLSVEPDPPEPE